MKSTDYFSNSYAEARTKFIEAVDIAGGRIQNYFHPDRSGPNGEALSIDTAWLGPDEAEVLLVCVSGAHGPEGFCGSATQLHSLKSGILGDLPPGVAVLLVHAVNPFGFAYMTRYNENNVDLNRNWIDFSAVPKTADIYPELHALLPETGEFNEELFGGLVGEMAGLFAKHGAYALENALSAGQYEYADGIGYGGHKLEWSTCVMESIVRSLKGRTKHIAYLDWHSLIRSGLDDFVYLSFNQPNGPMIKRCAGWWGAENVDPQHVNQKWDSGLGREGGRPERNGILMWGIQKAVAPEIDVAGGVVEFTDEAQEPLQQKVTNLRAMILSRYFAHKKCIETKKDVELFYESRELWCPTRFDWQEKSLDLAAGIFEKTLNGAKEWAAEKAPVIPDENTDPFC